LKIYCYLFIFPSSLRLAIKNAVLVASICNVSILTFILLCLVHFVPDLV
jgi:hypothetical protein